MQGLKSLPNEIISSTRTSEVRPKLVHPCAIDEVCTIFVDGKLQRVKTSTERFSMDDKKKRWAWQLYPWHSSKERILVGATIAFSRKGFYGTSVREISQEAGLEQPSIYHHFKNKENLYWNSLRTTHLYMIRSLKKKIVHKENLLAEIRDMFRAVSWFHKEYPEYFSLLFSLVYSSPQEIADRFTSLYGGDIFHFVDRAFDRNPPETGRLEKYSLTVHTLYSYILSFAGRRPEHLRVSYYRALRSLYLAL